jgi:carbamoyl-phosphate synthase small subunit
VHPALLVLEDGTQFLGQAFGHLSCSAQYSVGEVVFNTSMTGYQEILTDPSYCNQIVTLTYPHIGNVGVNLDDSESNNIFANGLIIKELPKMVSSWRQQNSLQSFMIQHKKFGICGIDTRQLTRKLRQKGSMNGCLVAAPKLSDTVIDAALHKARAFVGLNNQDLAKVVTTKSAYLWQEGGTWGEKTKHKNTGYHIVVYDFGVKKSILRCLQDFGCHVTVVPAKTTSSEVLKLKPDGVFLSNGPGDPSACKYAIESIKTLIQQNMPMFGICLGFQLLALSFGAKTFKMKFGHHGGNHPVKDIDTNKVFISSQNHGFAVQEPLPTYLKITHRSLFDNTLQGIEHESKPVFGFQGHPEAGPGPNEMRLLFSKFMQLIEQNLKSEAKPQEQLLVD